MFTYGDGEERSLVSGLGRKESERKTGDSSGQRGDTIDATDDLSGHQQAGAGRQMNDSSVMEETSCSASISIANGVFLFIKFRIRGFETLAIFSKKFPSFSVATVRKFAPKKSLIATADFINAV